MISGHMERTFAKTSQYVITAKSQRGVVQQTRTMAESAVVLAMMLQEDGHTDIEVTDPMGKLLSLEQSTANILSSVNTPGNSR